MKAQLILLFLLVGLISTKGFAVNKESQEDDKKTTKSKYEFNLFKFVSIGIEREKPDSLKSSPTTFYYLKRKED